MRSVIRYNAVAWVSRLTGHDFMGQPSFSSKRRTKVSVIYFRAGEGATSIRADRSETKARAEELNGKVRLLMNPKEKIKIGDRLSMFNHDLRVRSIFPNNDLNGRLHHLQVDLSLWEDGEE